MKYSPKLALSAAVLVALFEALLAVLGAPKAVNGALVSAYHINVLFGCFLAACAVGNGLFGYLRPACGWGKCAGACFPLGILVFSGTSYLTFTDSPAPGAVAFTGLVLIFVAFLSFFLAVVTARD